MIIARWEITAKFGQKTEAIRLLKHWDQEIGEQIGMDLSRVRTMTGSVGALESVIVQEIEFDSITAVDEFFERIKGVELHAGWGREMANVVVDGSNKWEIYRVVD
jgi:hypothetical protein